MEGRDAGLLVSLISTQDSTGVTGVLEHGPRCPETITTIKLNRFEVLICRWRHLVSPTPAQRLAVRLRVARQR